MADPTPNYGALAAEAFKAINAALSALFQPVEEPTKPPAGWYPEGAEDLGSAVRQAIGTASVCWTNMSGTGVFDEAQANAVAEGLIAWIEENVQAEVRRLRSTWTPPQDDPQPSTPAPKRTLAEDIAAVLNRHSAENGSNTPDFILAEALVTVLAVMDQTINDRGDWFNHRCSIGECDHNS